MSYTAPIVAEQLPTVFPTLSRSPSSVLLPPPFPRHPSSHAPNSPLGSAVGLTKMSGEIVAIAHPQKMTGFKNPNSYGSKPVFSQET